MPDRLGPLGLTEAETRSIASWMPPIERDGLELSKKALGRLIAACKQQRSEWDAAGDEPKRGLFRWR